MTADEIKAYYANLLIIQYNNKPKAWATIAALVNQVAQLDLLIFAMRSGGFTLDNAVGAQLDILGSWLGVRRYYYGVDTSKRYFGMPEYGDSFPAFLGFLRYGDDPASTQYFKQYSDLSPTSGLLGDGDFRRFLKYIAQLRVMNVTLESIDALMTQFFGSVIHATDNGDMTITYTIAANSDTVINMIVATNAFPKPAGVAIILA